MQEDAQNQWQGRSRVRPSTMLFVLTSVFCLIYLDRGAFSSNSINGKRRSDKDPDGSGFQGEFDLSNFEDGLLPSLFMVGILIGSPFFSQAIRYFNPFRLVGAGALIWAIAVGLCGLTVDFYTMAVCRAFVGFGEAAVLAIGPTYIDDKAPREKVTLWIAILHLAVPAGFALGFIYGAACEALFGWRSAFFLEALFMVPFIIYCFSVPPVSLNTGQRSRSEDNSASELRILWNDIVLMFSHPVYTVSVAGNCLHIGVLGVLSYWGAKAAKAMFDMDGTDLWIGGLVLLTGTIGILLGGALVDRLGSSISTALSVAFVADLICALVMAPAFLFIKEFEAFVFPFIVCFTCLFLSMAPLSVVSLWSVPLHLRPLATSMSTIVTHILGDMPSPPIFGLLTDLMESDFDSSEDTAYRAGFGAAALFLSMAAGVFYIGAEIGKQAKDYRAPVGATLEGIEEGTAPLLLPCDLRAHRIEDLAMEGPSQTAHPHP